MPPLRTALLISMAILQLQIAGAADRSAASPAAPQPMATVRQLMLGIVIPTSNVLFQAAYQEDIDDTVWTNVQANALSLAEAGMLLTRGPRVRDEATHTVIAAADRAQWNALAQRMIDAAAQSAQAAARKQQAELADASDALYETCDGCHKRFMKARAGQ